MRETITIKFRVPSADIFHGISMFQGPEVRTALVCERAQKCAWLKENGDVAGGQAGQASVSSGKGLGF